MEAGRPAALAVVMLVGVMLVVVPGFSRAATGVVSGFSRTRQTASATQALSQTVDEGRRQFEEFQYEAAIKALDRAIAVLVRSADSQPERLAEAYELRARSYYALGDRSSAEQDFTLLLGVSPDYTLGDEVSPPVVALFNAIKARTIGRVLIIITPATDLLVDGRRYAAVAGEQSLELAVGEHVVSVTRPGYRPMSERITVNAGVPVRLEWTLERVSSTVSIVTAPPGVEVVLDGTSRGTTSVAEGSDTSAPLVLDNVANGSHRLEFRRDCYARGERTLAIERPDDYAIGPVRLVAALAKVTFALDDPEAVVYVDGRKQSLVAGTPIEVCEGQRAIDVRSPYGRFVTRPFWRAGDTATLPVTLRPAMVIVDAAPADPRAHRERIALVEEVLGGASGLMFFAPTEPQLAPLLRGGGVALRPPPDNAPPDRWRDIGRRLTTELEAQGVLWFAPDPADRDAVQFWLLAAGSGVPDRLRVRRGDRTSQSDLLIALQHEAVPLVRRSIEATLVDVGANALAGVVRVVEGGAAAAAGLAAGDVIVSAGGQPVAGAAALDARLQAASGPVALDVRGPDGRARSVTVTPVDVPRIVPLAGRGLVYNKLWLELQEAARRATGAAKAAADLNLAAVQLRLGGVDDARQALERLRSSQLGGAWTATTSYLLGLAYEAAGRSADARAAFERATTADVTTLGDDGPSIAMLARQKLKGSPP